VKELLMPLLLVESFNPILVVFVNVPVADELAKRTVTWRGIVDEVDDVFGKVELTFDDLVNGHVGRHRIVQFVRQKVQINEELLCPDAGKV
jgi:hypothetical protein